MSGTTLHERIPPGVVLKYYLYRATTAAGFYGPILYLFFRSNGLSYTEIVIAEGVFMATNVFGEIPTGYVGDRIGWRNSLLVGAVVVALALVGLGLSNSFLAVAALHGVWALGFSFTSGSDQAWLYETLRARLDEDRFAHVRGRGTAVRQFVGVGGALAGGYLAGFDLAYPFFAAGGLFALGAVVLLTVPEIETGEIEPFSPADAVPVVRDRLLQPPLRSFVLYYSLFLYLTGVITIFVQPVAVDLGLSTADLGVVYAVLGVVTGATSYYTGEIGERVGVRTWFLVVPVVLGVAYVGIALVPLLLLPVYFVSRSASRITGTLASQHVNDNVETTGRATVLSAFTMVGSAFGIGVQAASGVLADLTSEVTTLGVAGALLLVAVVAIRLWETPVPDAADVGEEPSATD